MEKRKKFYCYSQNFKDAVLSEVRAGKLKIADIAKLYCISHNAIYNWMKRNDVPTPQREVIYVELKDKQDILEKNQELQDRIRSLEVALSDKVLENCALQALVNVAEKKYGLDLKKKTGLTASQKPEK